MTNHDPLTFVEIAVNVPQVTGVFHYHLPPELDGQVGAGCLVEVPFGALRVQGVVLRTIAEAQVLETRAVLALIDPLPVLTALQLELAHWMAEQSLAPLAQCIDRMLPPGLSQHAELLVHLNREQLAALPAAQLPAPETVHSRLIELLKRRGDLRAGQIERALNYPGWRNVAQTLARRGILRMASVLPPPAVRAKLVRTVQLACPRETAEAALPRLARPGTAAFERRQSLLRFLIREPWPIDVAWVYANSGAKLADLQELAEQGLVMLSETEVWRDPLSVIDPEPTQAFELTLDQQRAWDALLPGLAAAASGASVAPYLLHGVTGSGKTEIYLRAVAETIRMGRQAIVLVPEIALTPQAVQRFVTRFPGQVGLIHSRLSPGERYDTWRRARAGLISVVVGPRSALFAPLPNPGLIVLDECHDDSYYQGETPPYYHTGPAAAAYARRAGAVCLFGSATPAVAMRYQAEAEGWHRIDLPHRVLAHRQVVTPVSEDASLAPAVSPPDNAGPASLSLAQVGVVDMREELKNGNRSIFSRALQKALTQVLDAGQQAILFLNRRGTATFVFCRECGHSLRCPNCDIPLTFHSPPAVLICHYCAYRRGLPKSCPQCHSASLRQYGTGTEKVESEVQALFPRARTLRWDAETTRQKGSHEIILAHFAAHRADVLIGTQMLAKGLDLPLVTLVGAVLADVGLNLPDYRAGERTFQVLTQVAGRAGRSALGGQVILQTFNPQHYAIQAAAGQDYAVFYQQELAYRRALGYPPFYRLARLEYRHRQNERAEAAARGLAAELRGWIAEGDFRATEMIGPAPCFFNQLNGFHRWQIVLRSPDPLALLRGRALGEWRVEIDPASLL